MGQYCSNQYQCKKIFLIVAIAASNHNNNTIVIHKLAEKYQFKEIWDVTWKLAKERIMNIELKYN